MTPFLRNAIIVAASLFAVGGIVWWNWSAFERVGVAMPPVGWIALGLGTLFTIIVGCGLMFLVFWSSRRGYDEAPSREEPGEARLAPPVSDNSRDGRSN